MARILGDDGRELAEVTLAPGLAENGHGAVVERVSHGSGSLLRYYFVQGRRAVELDLGESRLTGTLSTRWLGGERQWVVRVNDDEGRPAASAERPERVPAA
jgi:hypothetical protein